jgi:CHAT domain-containing protein
VPAAHQARARGTVPTPLSQVALSICVPLLILLHAAPSPKGAASPQEETTEVLDTGQVVSTTFSGKSARTYEIRLEKDDFLKVAVEQLGVDVGLSFYSPGGAVLAEIDSPTGAFDAEELVWVATEVGRHRLVVTPFDEALPGARVEVRLVEKRSSRASDRPAVEAQRFFSEGYKLLQDEKTASQRRGVELAQRAAAAWGESGNTYERAVALAAIASSLHNYLNESEQAVVAATEAGTIFQALGRFRLERGVLMARGIAEYRLQRMPEALKSFERALALADAAGDANDRAQILSNQGMVYDALGEKGRAVTAYLDALAILRSGRNREVELYTHNNLAVIYEDQGERQKALDAYRRSLEIARELKARKSEAGILANIGRVHERLGDDDRAMEYIRQSLAISRELDDRHSEGVAQLRLGQILAARKDPRGAFEFFETALALFSETKDERSQALTRVAESDVRLQAGDGNSSRDIAERALEDARRLHNPFIEAMSLTSLGNALAALGEDVRALERFRETVALREKLGDRLGLANTRLAMARVERKRGERDSALADARAALDLLESLRTEVASHDLRASFFAVSHDAYAFTLDLLAAMHRAHLGAGFDRQALDVAERARARSLLDLLAESRVEIREGVDPVLLETDQALRRRVGARLDAQARLLSSRHTEAQAAAAAAEIDSLRNQMRDVEESIRARSPRYAALRQPVSLPAAEIQKQLDPDTALLELALGEENAYLWTVTPTSVRLSVVCARPTLESLARRYREALTARNARIRFESAAERSARIRRADTEAADLARELGRILLGTASETLSHRVLYVADGALQYVPLAALAPPGGVPLIAAHEIVTLPSASVIAVLRSDSAARRAPTKMLAVLADPVFDARDPRVRGAGSDRASAPPEDVLRSLEDAGENGIARLPNTRREADAILALVPPALRKAALDFDASRATATSPSLGDYRIVHFATHSLLNASHPDLSGVVLSLVDREGRPQAGFLSTMDVFNLRLPVDLVVLSGCRTALGKDVRGEGLVGLPRGFLYAGASRVVSSLWKVDDAATADLMTALYREMLGARHASPAAALAAAQHALWRTKGRSAAYYWAGFTLQGEWR